MLYNDLGSIINIVTKDQERAEEYTELKKRLSDKNLLNILIKYLEKEVEKFFNFYEEQGKEAHLKAVYIVGSNWDNIPIRHISEDLLVHCNNNQKAFDLSKQMVGCFLKEVIINSLETYLAEYFPEKGYIFPAN